MGVAQVGLIVRDQLAVQLAARDAARAAAVSGDPSTAAQRAAQAAGVVGPLEVSVSNDGSSATATVSYVERTDLPLVGLLIPDVTLRASATMSTESP